jgi:sugar lactone lactonase YvrE
MLRQITQGATRPLDDWIDQNGILYVVNGAEYPTQANVVEYKRGASSPFRTITDGVQTPNSVAVGKDGTVYVNSVGELPDGGGTTGMVVVYPPGGVTPKLTITLPEAPEYGMSAGGIALDAQGNVYVANFGNATVSQFFKIAPGSSQATSLGLTGYGGDAIAIDGAGNLYAGGASDSYFIAVYAPGATSPSRTIPLNFAPYGLTVTGNGTLYVVGDENVAEFAPGANTPTNTISTLYGETFTIDAAIGSQ